MQPQRLWCEAPGAASIFHWKSRTRLFGVHVRTPETNNRQGIVGTEPFLRYAHSYGTDLSQTSRYGAQLLSRASVSRLRADRTPFLLPLATEIRLRDVGQMPDWGRHALSTKAHCQILHRRRPHLL